MREPNPKIKDFEDIFETKSDYTLQWKMYEYDLTHYRSISHFYTPRKYQKTK